MALNSSYIFRKITVFFWPVIAYKNGTCIDYKGAFLKTVLIFEGFDNSSSITCLLI